MKRRKHKKRSARRGGRVMTVTTSSRVVKTTRMNPFGTKRQRYEVTVSFKDGTKQRIPALAKSAGGAIDVVKRKLGGRKLRSVDTLSCGIKSNPHRRKLSASEARSLFDRYNKARERDSAPTEAERKARNDVVIRRMRKNPRIVVRVTTSGGHHWTTPINTDLEGAKKYFLGASFDVSPFPDSPEKMERVVKVEQVKSNPPDPRTAQTQRIPAIRVMIPAGSKDPRTAETRRLRVITSSHRKNPGPTAGEIRNLQLLHQELVIAQNAYKHRTHRDDAHKLKRAATEARLRYRRFWRLAEGKIAAERKNPVRSLVVPRTMWKRLKRADKRLKHGHRYVRCKTRRARRAFWLPCTIR